MRKKLYIVPETEIVLLETERIMALGDPSGKGGYAPARHQDAVSRGPMF